MGLGFKHGMGEGDFSRPSLSGQKHFKDAREKI